MAKLKKATRKKLANSVFALPGRRFPVNDRAHARAALLNINKGTTPAERVKIRRKAMKMLAKTNKRKKKSRSRTRRK